MSNGFGGWEVSKRYRPSSVLHAPGCNEVQVTDPARDGPVGWGGGAWTEVREEEERVSVVGSYERCFSPRGKSTHGQVSARRCG